MLTSKQIELVQQSWRLVAAEDLLITGQLFYNCLFEMAPEVKIIFSNTSIHAQSGKFLSMMDYIISNLHNAGSIVPGIEKLAAQHIQYGLLEAHYTMVGRALLWTLQKKLGDAWNKELKQAWIVGYTMLAEAMMKASKINERVY